ncbi:hypothetical protein T265_15496, partial [Opisthorchis viverrini]
MAQRRLFIGIQSSKARSALELRANRAPYVPRIIASGSPDIRREKCERGPDLALQYTKNVAADPRDLEAPVGHLIEKHQRHVSERTAQKRLSTGIQSGRDSSARSLNTIPNLAYLAYLAAAASASPEVRSRNLAESNGVVISNTVLAFCVLVSGRQDTPNRE